MDTAVKDGSEVELTELEKIEATRVDGVETPANGFPILMLKAVPPAAAKAGGGGKCATCGGKGKIMDGSRDCPDCDGPAGSGSAKSVPAWLAAAKQLVTLGIAAPGLPREVLWKAIAADGSVDEQPDIDGGVQAIGLLGKLIGYEAQELEAGHVAEIGDIQLLTQASSLVAAWLSVERAGSMGDTDAAAMDQAQDLLLASAAKAKMSSASQNDLPDSAFAYIEPGGKKDSDGKTTPRSLRHFPVHDKAHADNAAARIAQGAEFGEQAKAKVTAAQKRFGESDAGKSAVAEGEGAVDTVAQGTVDLAQIVEAAVTKATDGQREELKALRSELAKVKATPIPGGPVMSVTRAPRADAPARPDWDNPEYLRKMADSISDPASSESYRQLARQAEERAQAATTT
jgi:hypothetical protein